MVTAPWSQEGGSISLNWEKISIWISLALQSAKWTHPDSSHTYPTKLRHWDAAKPKEIDELTNRVLSDLNHPYSRGWKPLDENCRRVQMSAVHKNWENTQKTDVHTAHAKTDFHASVSTHSFLSVQGVIYSYHCNWSNRRSFPVRKEFNCDDSLLLTASPGNCRQKKTRSPVPPFPQSHRSLLPPLSFPLNSLLNSSLLLRPLYPESTSKEYRSS